MEEERFAIMNDTSVSPGEQGSVSHEVGEGQEMTRAATTLPRTVVMTPLPVLLERLRTLWSRPPTVTRGVRRPTCGQGGNGPQHDPSSGSSCASLSTCVEEEESRQREDMCDVTMSELDGAWGNPGPPGREEM